MKRIDLLNGEKLLRKYRIKVTEAAIGIAGSYIAEKRDGETSLEFPEWLNQDLSVEVVDEKIDGLSDEPEESPVWVEGISDEEPEEDDQPNPTTPSS